MTDKSGSPPCGIYVRIDDYSDMQTLITELRQMAMVINRASGYEKNMHVVELVFDEAKKEEIADLTALMQGEGLVVVLSGAQPDDEKDLLGADGVLLENIEACRSVRSDLGEEAIIGLICGGDRGMAEKALALDIDYVSLSPDEGLVSWWSMQSDIPCLVTSDLTNDTCGAFVRAGATFVEAGDYIFGHDKGVMQGTINMLYALDLAAEIPEKLN